jgi:hypothetical protein
MKNNTQRKEEAKKDNTGQARLTAVETIEDDDSMTVQNTASTLAAKNIKDMFDEAVNTLKDEEPIQTLDGLRDRLSDIMVSAVDVFRHCYQYSKEIDLAAKEGRNPNLTAPQIALGKDAPTFLKSVKHRLQQIEKQIVIAQRPKKVKKTAKKKPTLTMSDLPEGF